MRIALLFSLFFIFFRFGGISQVRIMGKILDQKTHEPVPNSYIQLLENGKLNNIAASDRGGFIFESEDSVLSVLIKVSHTGYVPFSRDYIFPGDTIIAIYLSPQIITIPEVIIEESRLFRSTNTHFLSAKNAGLTVSVMGEPDIIRPLRVLPGISQGIDGSMSLFVRGSNNGNNRIEMDGVPVYGAGHLFGLTSIFQTELVDQVVFKMGGISAQKGNFLSSVTQVETKNPLSLDREYSISVSPFMAGFHAVIPSKSKPFGAVLGGRYSLLQQEINLIKRFADLDANIMPQVFDGFVKLVWQPTTKSLISSTFFSSNDYFGFSLDDGTEKSFFAQNWYNNIYSLVWDYDYNANTVVKTTLYYNHFKNLQKVENYTRNKLNHGRVLSSGIGDFSANTTIRKTFNQIHIDAGFQTQSIQYKPAYQKLNGPKKDVSSGDISRSFLASLFVSAQHNWNERLVYQAGLRASFYQLGKFNLISPDLRLSLDYLLFPHFGINTSYDQFTQFYHALEGLPMGWSLDILVPANEEYPPSRAHQLYSGIFWQKGNYHINLGGYWKTTSNIAGYTTSQNLFSAINTTWDTDVGLGKGNSIGMEFMVNRKSEKWNWDIAYTLSQSTRKFPQINKGQTFPFKFDRPHILNIQTEKIVRNTNNRLQSVFATLSLSSGHKTTMTIGEYPGDELPYWSIRKGTTISSTAQHLAYQRQLMTGKNDYAMPTYFRLDLGYTFKRIRRRYTREFTITCFNATNRRNPYLYFRENQKWNQLTIFPILPSFRYKVVF